MTNPMTKILPALLSLAMMTGAASAQQRTFYDAGGKVVGRSATDSSGTTTNYDAREGTKEGAQALERNSPRGKHMRALSSSQVDPQQAWQPFGGTENASGQFLDRG
jgi:hypothetical protein